MVARVRGRGGVVLTLTFDVGDRLESAAEQWAETRLTDREEARRITVEQALLEIEHLVSGAHDVEFEVDGRTVRHEASDDLRALLAEQTAGTDLDESALLARHADLFAGAFLDDDAKRPPNAPPPD